jgi:hypothetical protein
MGGGLATAASPPSDRLFGIVGGRGAVAAFQESQIMDPKRPRRKSDRPILQT